MITVHVSNNVFSCMFLDDVAREATFIFREGYNVNSTNGILGTGIPEGGNTANDASKHVPYHQQLQAAYDQAYPQGPKLDCSDNSRHAHYRISKAQSSGFASALTLANRKTQHDFGWTKVIGLRFAQFD